MASLLSSTHPTVLSANPKPHRNLALRFPPVHLSVSTAIRSPNLRLVPVSATSGDPREPDPRPIPISIPSNAGEEESDIKVSRIDDEGGEEEEPEPEASPPPDPTKASGIPDEWGEKAEPESQASSPPDPTEDDDEWGTEAGEEDKMLGNGTPVPDGSGKLEDLKQCLVDCFYGTELGFRTSAETRAEIFELVSQLEAVNPNPAALKVPELLDGNWILLYTAFSELLPLLAVGTIPLLKIKKISQIVDTKSSTIVNATTISSPFATYSFSASASFEVRSPSRIEVKFTEATFDPPEISSTLELPGNLDIAGRTFDLSPVRQALRPLQDAFANIARALSGQPPLKVPIPGNRTQSWLLTTYLDKDLRISRGDGGLFVLAKEGSPLFDQLL